MDFIEIKIKDFGKLVKRKDITNPTWFAMPNDILSHPDFFTVTGAEFKAFVWIIGVASKLNKDTIRVYPDVCAQQANIPKKDVNSSIEKLNKKRWDIRSALRECDGDVTRVSRECHATEQNRTEQDTTKELVSTVVTKVTPVPTITASPQDLLSTMPKTTIARWQLLYQDDEFLKREVIKALGWCQDNPKKTPKSISGWSRFLSGWFERGWGYRAKDLPSNRKTYQPPTDEEMLKGFGDPDDAA